MSMTSPVPFTTIPPAYIPSPVFSSSHGPPPPALTLANLSKFESKFEPKFEPNLATQMRPMSHQSDGSMA
jgi:hypothetical protein